MLRHVTLAALAAALLAGCSGGAGSPGAPSQVPTQAPTSAPQGTTRQITFTISFTKSEQSARLRRQAGKLRHTKYISPNTGSIGVAVNGGAASYSPVSCNGSQCTASITVAAPVNQVDTFDVTDWSGPDGPNSGGVLLSEGSASSYISAGGTIVIPVTLGGVVAQIVSINLTNTSFTSGTSGSATLTVTAKDPSGAVIVGCYQNPVPVQIFENDFLTAFSFSNQGVLTQGEVIGSGSTQDGCPAQGSSLPLYYSGSQNGPSFPADVVLAADLPGTQGQTFNFTWGQTNQYGLFFNGADDATTVVDEVQTTCPGGGVPCAYYEPALLPYLTTVTGLGGAASPSEPGSPAVWSTDNFTGLVSGITANGAFTIYPTNGEYLGPPNSPDPANPSYSIPLDLGGGDLLIANYSANNPPTGNLVEFKDSNQSYNVLRPAYTGAGFASPNVAAPSVFEPDGAGNLWFVDPYTAAVDQADSTGGNVVSCALTYSDGVTPVAADALAVSASTVWASTIVIPNSNPEQFFLARFPTSVSGQNPCTIPFGDLTSVPNEVDRIAVDAGGNLWYVDNAENLGYIPAAGGTPATQSLGKFVASNLILQGSYFYAVDSADGLLLRIATAAAPPNAVVQSAPLPASWDGVSDLASNFNDIWITAGPGTTLWFAGDVKEGLRAPTNQVFEIDPSQLTFGSNARIAHVAARFHHPAARHRGVRSRQLPIRRSLPNFGF
jgi:hypothetical protein